MSDINYHQKQPSPATTISRKVNATLDRKEFYKNSFLTSSNCNKLEPLLL